MKCPECNKEMKAIKWTCWFKCPKCGYELENFRYGKVEEER